MADPFRPKDAEAQDLELLRLKAKLWALQAKVEKQEKLQRSLTPRLDELRTAADIQEASQQRIELRLAEQHEQIQENARRITSIVQSRIWRTLAAVGGLFLPARRKGVEQYSPPSEPTSPPESRPRRGAAEREQHEVVVPEKRVEDWREELRRVARGLDSLRGTPCISIITPTFNPKTWWLVEAALSVFQQTFRDWEWCIVDDCSDRTEFHELLAEFVGTSRITIGRLAQRGGISAALNHGLAVARGEFVCFLDHDDVLDPDALKCCHSLLSRSFDAVYTDEDKISESGVRHTPLPKPDWSPEFFRWVMYIGHLLCVRRDMALAAGGFRSEYDRIQDYEFMLRYSERTQRIGHVSKILYHWRAVEGSVAAAQDAKGDLAPLQVSAVQAHMDRLELAASALPGPRTHMLRLNPKAQGTPHVSIVLAAEGGLERLADCVVSVFGETTYGAFEVICMARDASSKLAARLIQEFPIKSLSNVCNNANISCANNLGARRSSGRFIAFLGEDVRVVSPDWIEQMLYYAEQEDVGCVGGLLMQSDDTIKHAGIMISTPEGDGDRRWRLARGEPDGYWGSSVCAHEVTGVSGSCAMLSRELFMEIGGFDRSMDSPSRDVDLCLRLRSRRKRIVFTPNAAFLDAGCHGTDPAASADDVLLLERWGDFLRESDPYYKRNSSASPTQ